jgi:hypothetical protein
MSFNVGGSTVALEFDAGTVLAGATVMCSLDMSIRDFVQMQRIWSDSQDGDISRVLEAYQMFGDAALVSWDLTLRGEVLPATGESLIRIPAVAANAIFSAWTSAVSGTSSKSPAASESGSTSEAA